MRTGVGFTKQEFSVIAKQWIAALVLRMRQSIF